jgi:hypothetical protein
MAGIRDWLELGRSTVRSLKSSDVSDLYALEWPAAFDQLTADHRGAIEREPKAIKRLIRTNSAVMYGLAKRLSPIRRLLFVLANFAFLISVFGILTRAGVKFWIWDSLLCSFFLLTLLLGMELIDKLKFRDELELARELQAGLIPKTLPRFEGFELGAFNAIANTVGGDIYDFVPLSDGRMAILFGDASGHGMTAGLVMAVAHAAFRTQLEIDPSPPAIIGALNRILCRTGSRRSFFSSCYLVVAPDGSFVATLAGHPQILRVDPAGRIVERIGTGSYPLGIKPGLVWQSISGALACGESLVLHSDGLTEARSAAGRDLGDDYLESIIGWFPGASAPELVESIVAEWQSFTGRRPPEDDVSVAVIRSAGLVS